MAARNRMSGFLGNVRGNVAVLSAIAALAMIGVVGAGVDLSLLTARRAATQDALDAATLYAASLNSADPAALKTVTINAFNANIAGSEIKSTQNAAPTVTGFTYDSTKQTVTAVASGVYDPIFGQFLGLPHVPYQVTSTTNRAVNGTVEVALVLDNTWSMSVPLDGGDTKINVLKTAADNLIATLMTPGNAGSVKVGVVPYAEYVNVGLSNRSQPWLSVAADSSTTAPPTWIPDQPPVCTTVSTKTTTTCTGGQQGTCTSYADGVPTGTYTCWVVPQTCTSTTVPITPKTTCTADVPAHWQNGATTTSTWYGCVKNQVQGSKLMLPDPSTPYVGIMESYTSSNACLSAIQPLTGTASVAKASVDGMIIKYPHGGYPYTYIPGGLVWGVNVLSPPAPFNEGAA